MNKKKKRQHKKTIKEVELKINVLIHELLAFTLSYLMLTCDTPILQISLHRLLSCQVCSSSVWMKGIERVDKHYVQLLLKLKLHADLQRNSSLPRRSIGSIFGNIHFAVFM
jgi:DNA-directed RNA polymerase subunit RPC12/RpoP